MNAIFLLRAGRRLRTAAGLTGALLLGACASAPPPTAALQAAQLAITTADQAEAGRYAPAELSEARLKLAAANTAVSDKQMIIAQQQAEDASAEAQLAGAKTAQVKAEGVNEEMRRSTATLIDEMQRKGDQP
jgi:hypothetical protein